MRQFNDLYYAFDGQRRCAVNFQRAILGAIAIQRIRQCRHQRAQYRRVQHAGYLHIHAVARAARHLLRHIDARHVATDQPPLRRRFQIFLGQRRRIKLNILQLDHFHVTEFAARRGMHHVVGFGGAFARRNLPCARGVGDQNRARLRTGQTRDAPVALRPAAAAHALPVEIFGIDKRFVRRRLLDADGAPVGIQFFGDQQRYRRVHALPHFGRRALHRNGVLAIGDMHPGVQINIAFFATGMGVGYAQQAAGHQRKAQRNAGALEECATLHQVCFAARSIAAMMRLYEPQRQRFVFM